MSDPALRGLPPVHAVLTLPEIDAAIARRGRQAVLAAIRTELDRARDALRRGENPSTSSREIAGRVVRLLDTESPALRPVINATGVLLHTGLGRAPLAAEAAEAVDRVVRGYCNLEFHLETGDRGQRTDGIAHLLRRLTGAEAATVVNNNAAATVLALRALAAGREVVVSRGQLVEIGGSFRLPEIFEASGARLREVGTTNRTRLTDYRRAIGPDTAALMRVHPSNFRVVGFTESVPVAELAMLGREHGLFTIDDIGSGALRPGAPPGISGEPTVKEGLDAGADLVLFSGDKLLGGPQCGILAGTRAAVDRVAADPLMRAVRVDKMTLAALEATLILAMDSDLGARRIPLWHFLTTPLPALFERATRLADRLRAEARLAAEPVESTSYLGGGSLPVEPIPTAVVRIGPPWPDGVGPESEVARSLRLGDPAVVPRVQDGAVLLDLRTVPPDRDDDLAGAVLRLVARPAG